MKVETTCGSLLNELKGIWDDVGESDIERDKMLLELERECLEVYRRKVDSANKSIAQLRQAIADAEAELAFICSAMGERPIHIRQVPVYIAEIAPQNMPGLGSVNQLAVTIGIMLSYLLGLFVNWRVLAVLVHFHGFKLQVQERLTRQIAETVSVLVGKDVMVVVECNHTCMISRGIEKFGSSTATMAVLGRFSREPAARVKFLHIIPSPSASVV
ncbi:hypothetical protein POM88_026738 [Heracleum sosnowskyi]|uniref:GTP cyclohydrolase I domain-containing protein n=1 Tax=Heracleum sosnowskyi TaxID=360622 RepID=A0AAD8I7P7_9APIA|nr:hypothetical protein POM88_026738 [Heracleum sosnowskyi]